MLSRTELGWIGGLEVPNPELLRLLRKDPSSELIMIMSQHMLEN